MKLEKDKVAEYRAKQRELGLEAAVNGEGFCHSPETITALRQNLSQPGKLVYVNLASLQLRMKDFNVKPLPYENVTELLVIADSSNNRLIVIDASTHTFLEQIGNGKSGYQEGSFAQAEFSLPQGLCHYLNSKGEHCLMVCDVKNHLIRKVNLHKKYVRHIAGIKGVRGSDLTGGELPATEQELASPWDIV